MDRDSQPSSRPPAGSGRGGRSSRARSGSTQPAPASATSSPSRAAAHHSHTGETPGWPQQRPPVPPNAPRNYEEVARALRTIQDAHPLLVQSMASQQGFPWDPNQFPPNVPPHLTSQPPWPPTQLSTSHGVAAPPLPLDFGSLYPRVAITYHPVLTTQLPHYPHRLAPYPENQAFKHSQQRTPRKLRHSMPRQVRRRSAEGILPRPVCTRVQHVVLYHAITQPYVLIARFRVKKKLQTHNLERTVSDLTGRIDELEQEASDLRRENTWLKEIVVLKSNSARRGEPHAGPSSSHGSRKDHDIDEDAEEESRPSDE
ncbi:hypothetical protein BJV78DRAFT_28720 [Lactifluus subvellereus]|nr:hypothetical protein BJV78DRAFT_28720 [Lactifluus subvellereus]